MSSTGTSPFVLRWGIIGCGRISGTFVKDLVLSPSASTSSSFDVVHAVIACGSRTLSKAEEFIAQFCPEGAYAQKVGLVGVKPEAKGSYDEVYNHKDVDAIYIGTPHTSHFEDAQAALNAGKHVLLEKPATLNKAEFTVLASLAQSKKLFLMEAVWTRFFPLTFALQDLLFKQKVIGDIKRVVSDFSIDFVHVVDENHRMRNPRLAGGGLLDLGPYPLVWAMMILYHHPDNKLAPPSKITASMIKHPESGIDLFTDFTLDFENIGARANLSTSIVLNSPKDVVTRIQGTEGEVLLPWVTARPDKFIVRRSKIGRGAQDYTEELHVFPIEGMGLHWEADAVARSIRDGETENPRMPLKETLLTMEIFDEVRKQGGYVFPPGLEKVQAS